LFRVSIVVLFAMVASMIRCHSWVWQLEWDWRCRLHFKNAHAAEAVDEMCRQSCRVAQVSGV